MWRISENPSASGCMSAQWEREEWRRQKWQNSEEMRKVVRGRTRGRRKESDVVINDSSPPASHHAEFVHMSVRKREAFVNKPSVGVCVCMSRPAVDNVCLSAHSSRGEQNNPPEKQSNTKAEVQSGQHSQVFGHRNMSVS